MHARHITIISFSIALILLCTGQSSFAEPFISDVSGDNHHNGVITISGGNFGAKSPAAPLWWDNMEGAPNGSTSLTSGELSWVTSGSLSGSNKHYSEALPASGGESSALMTYRNVNYRQVDGPHPFSTKYATGAHWQFPNNSPQYSNSSYQNVVLTVDSRSANKNVWFVRWYYRVDPNWELINNYENHKMSAPNYGTTIYDRPNCYMTHSQEATPGKAGDNTINNLPNCTGGCSNVEERGPNPKVDWVAYEQLFDSPNGFHELWRFGGPGRYSGLTNYLTSSCQNVKNNTRSFSLGGWFTTNTNLVESSKRGGQNNFRYFDDVYVDNTFSRVVLADSQDYAAATIVEPQIPVAWSGNSIRATLNIGMLPTGRNNYLFVFDANNTSNPTGIPVYISSDQGEPPPPSLSPPLNPRVVVQ